MTPMDAAALRERIPEVVGVIVRRGAEFASSEDAVQSALVRALEVWPNDPPHDLQGWFVTTAWRKFIDQVRSDGARTARDALGPGLFGEPGNATIHRLSRCR